MGKSKRKPATKIRIIKREFDVDLTLLANRQLFLQEEIDEDSAQKINKHLFALDTVNHKPIMLYIDSLGGCCSAGFSIINTMKTIESSVITIINGEASSTAGSIAISGNKRVCYENSSWMAHDVETEFEGPSMKFKDRAKYIEKYYQLIEINLRQHTKLTEKELKKARNGELWLFADDMLDKGIVDEIIVHEK